MIVYRKTVYKIADICLLSSAYMNKKVTINPGCITCGLCESIEPEVFEVTDVARVRPDAPVMRCLQTVHRAAAECPVQVIQISDGE